MTLYPIDRHPCGAEPRVLPKASLAELRTSKELVADQEGDASFFRTLEQHGILLNAPQIQAVRHGNGPLLTLAGAGTGKTTVLVCRAAYLITVHRVPPRQLLLVTFSKKAAEEMRERLARMPGLSASVAAQVEIKTFHAFCLRILRSRGYTQDIWHDTRHQHIQLKRFMLEMGLQDAYQPEALLSLLSSYKMQMLELTELPEHTAEEKDVKALLLRYEQWKAEHHKIDFDDVLLLAYRELKEQPSLLRTLQRRFHYLCVDEFQDTTKVQYELVQLLAAEHTNLMVVGDDDQTIYSFAGARHEFILEFDLLYPQAASVVLDINYRSTASIVGLGNEVIRHNFHRRPKTLQATRESRLEPRYVRPVNNDVEAEWLVNDLMDKAGASGKSYNDIAILYRTESSNRAILEQLISRGVPFVDYGDRQSFYDQWMVRPLVDHLRLALDHRSFEAMESVLPTLYIGREQGMKLIYDREAAGKPKKWPMIHLLELPNRKEFQQDKLKERLKLIRMLQGMQPVEAIRLMRRDFYDQFLETNKRSTLTQHKEMLREALDELEASAQRFGTIEQFLAFVKEMAEKRQEMSGGNVSQEDAKVSLMTIHKSKGLEFPIVYLIGAVEGNLPHSSAMEPAEALEEERRLAYVAITRAKEELTISSPDYFRGKKAQTSRFLLAAYPKPEQPRAAAVHAATPPAGPREPVFAWVCSSGSCHAWQRIIPHEEEKLASKTCPLCKGTMVKGSKHM
jgi:DNA helicase II / ATP-dependent DNA helicase PcrA